MYTVLFGNCPYSNLGSKCCAAVLKHCAIQLEPERKQGAAPDKDLDAFFDGALADSEPTQNGGLADSKPEPVDGGLTVLDERQPITESQLPTALTAPATATPAPGPTLATPAPAPAPVPAPSSLDDDLDDFMASLDDM